MYSELTPRVLVGGYVSPRVDPNILVRNGVTHVVNASDREIDKVIKNQFVTLELSDANADLMHTRQYWPKMFVFTRRALRCSGAKLYIHVSPGDNLRPAMPIACYAALLALGYSHVNARQRLLATHPIIVQQEVGMCCVNRSFSEWREKHRRVRPVKAEIIIDEKPEPPSRPDDLGEWMW